MRRKLKQEQHKPKTLCHDTSPFQFNQQYLPLQMRGVCTEGSHDARLRSEAVWQLPYSPPVRAQECGRGVLVEWCQVRWQRSCRLADAATPLDLVIALEMLSLRRWHTTPYSETENKVVKVWPLALPAWLVDSSGHEHCRKEGRKAHQPMQTVQP